MAGLKTRSVGVAMMGLGAWLFILAVQDAREGTGRTLTGLLSVFCLALGFSLLLIPSVPSSAEKTRDGSL